MKSTRCSTASTRARSAPSPRRHRAKRAPYDFSREMRIVRGRMPTLEMVNERFARQLRVSLSTTCCAARSRSRWGRCQMKKFSEYTHSLSLPVNLNLVKINPLRGTGAVRHRSEARVRDGRQLLRRRRPPGEDRRPRILRRPRMRIVHMFLRSAFADMKEAWTPIAKHRHRVRELGDQPAISPASSPPRKSWWCARSRSSSTAAAARCTSSMPYSMIEPLREVLDSGVQSDRAEQDERWLNLLKDGLQDAEVELTTLLGNGSVSLSKLVRSASPATCCPAISPARPPCSPKACRCSAARSACRAASSASGTNRNTGANRCTEQLEELKS